MPAKSPASEPADHSRSRRHRGRPYRIQGKLTLDHLVQQIEADEIDTVIVALPDLQGRLMGKRLTGAYFLDHIDEGLHACDYLLAMDVDNDPVPGFSFTSWDKGYGDVHAEPDFETIRRLPWLEKTALILCDAQVPIAPRQVLRDQVQRALSSGFTPMMGSELEFYLFRDSFEDAAAKRYSDLVPYGSYIEDYHILQGTKAEWLLREIRNSMEKAAIPVENSKGEWGFGQQEINLRYAGALEMADRHVIYKNGIKEIAALNGVAVTFMAKWNTGQAGSSFHLHSSLWDGERPLFADDGAEPHQMSKLFKHYLAGQLALAREFSIFFAPYVNSYKRYQAASFAPTSIAWSYDNRTCGFRLVGHGSSLHIESRLPGADANPYLAFAATIAAGLYGIEKKLDLEEEFRGDAYSAAQLRRVPSSLHEAIRALEESSIARELLGEQVVEHYLHSARMEQKAFDGTVTDWELRRNFERI